MSDIPAWLQGREDIWKGELGRVCYGVIVADLEKEFKRRAEKFKEELKKRDEDRQALSARFIEETIKNSRLVDENSKLSARVQKLQAKEPASASNAPRLPSGDMETGENQGASATVSCEEYRHLADKYNDLSKAHQEILKQLKYQQRKNHAVMEKNREMKKSVKDWQEYSHRHLKRRLKYEAISEVPAVLSSDEKDNGALPTISSPKSSNVRSPLCFSALDRSSPLPDSPDVREQPSSQTAHLHPTITGPEHTRLVDPVHMGEPVNESRSGKYSHTMDVNSANNPAIQRIEAATTIGQSTPFRNQSDTNQVTSSQVTEDEILDAAPSRGDRKVAAEEEDIPQVISERSLKRKRNNATRFEAHPHQGWSDGTPAKPYAVKDEQYSSPPASSTNILFRKETLDLDELGPNILSTPRGQPRIGLSSVIRVPRHQRSTSVPLVKEEVMEGEELSSHVNNVMVYQMDGPEARAFSEPTDQARINTHALRNLDPNVQSAQPIDDPTPRKRQRRGDCRAVSGYRILVESGDDLPPLDEDNDKLPPSAARARFNRRLNAGKEIQTPTRGEAKLITAASSVGPQARQIPTPPHSTHTSADTPSSRPGSRKVPPPISRLGTKRNSPPEVRPGSVSKPNSRNEPASGRKKEPPLRTKRLSELRTTDFKPNPAFNQGYSFAFAETVRKRADRACLPSCTRPECCGSTFRAMAAALPLLPSSQEEGLLEEYLGDAYDTMSLTQMSAAERKELILQARTREMAEKSGKHKQGFARGPSPPGFWRTEFANTQENEEDRAKAAEIEKQLVEERYMEAMREGGRWLFKDE